jgi:hypothetical protein
LLILFKVFSHQPLINDMVAGAGLFLRGKVPIVPHSIRAARPVHRLFEESK